MTGVIKKQLLIVTGAAGLASFDITFAAHAIWRPSFVHEGIGFIVFSKELLFTGVFLLAETGFGHFRDLHGPLLFHHVGVEV